MRYRKKPVVIEAIQFMGPASVGDMRKAWGESFNSICSFSEEMASKMPVATLEGLLNACHEAHIGDWIIRGIKGEFYPCRDDIFKETYQLVPPLDEDELKSRLGPTIAEKLESSS